MKSHTTFDYLTEYGVKPSVQRMAVMDYLLNHRTHPTADNVYRALHPKLPTLSKTTVYNTLKLLAEQNAVLQLTIDEKKVCYDANTEPHAHFLCRECNKVYDIPMEQQTLASLSLVPRDFKLESSQLYFHGCCPACIRQRKQDN